MKDIILHQCQEIVDDAAEKLAGADVPAPPEGWVRTLRKALGMNGAQLGRRAGMSRAQISNIETSEPHGSVTLKSLNALSQAMGCRIVYAIVPETTSTDLIKKQAYEKASQLIKTAGTHMALEDQSLNKEQRQFELDRIARKLIQDMPRTLWDDA